ncbi:uncharacterized protein [Rutidosis leptorrhynchoides]|uniref:uncharacterized protein n=1 Tax=Rutidosis leptorrhynchoides TaxID=125765 RepID=UPI003A99AE3C
MSNNLLSVSQVYDKRHKVLFDEQQCYIMRKDYKVPENMILMTVPRYQDLYILDMSKTYVKAAKGHQAIVSKATEQESMLWHKRMGYLSFRKMNHIIHNCLVEGVNVKGFHVPDGCVPCKKGKQAKKPHKIKKHHSIDTPLELLHMDLFGPINKKSITGHSFGLVVVMLKSKADTFEQIRLLITRLETMNKLRVGNSIQKLLQGDFWGYGNACKRVYNLESRCIEQCTEIDVQRHATIPAGKGYTWQFDYDKLFDSFNLPEDDSEDEEIAAQMMYNMHISAEHMSNVHVQSQVPNVAEEIEPVIGPNDDESDSDDSVPALEESTLQSEGDDLYLDDVYEDVVHQEPIQPVIEEPIQTANVDPLQTNTDDSTETDGLRRSSRTVSLPKHFDNYVVDPAGVSGANTGESSTSDEHNQTGRIFRNAHCCFVSQIEHEDVKDALQYDEWVSAMHEELQQFNHLGVWRLVIPPSDCKPYGLKWVLKNKTDDQGIVIRNKARLVVRGYQQIPEIDYDEVYASVARLEAIRMFLAFASWKGFKVF